MTAFTELGRGRISLCKIRFQEKRLQDGSSEQGLQRKSPELESNDPETEAAALACDGALTSIGVLEPVNRHDERRQCWQEARGRQRFPVGLWPLHRLLTIPGTLPYLLKVI